MKYIVYYKYDPKDLEKCLELNAQITEERKKNPKKYTRLISDNYTMNGDYVGFVLAEADNEEQLLNATVHYFPFMTLNWVPIIESSKTLAALREKTKK